MHVYISRLEQAYPHLVEIYVGAQTDEIFTRAIPRG
jgi:hypothetical protein